MCSACIGAIALLLPNGRDVQQASEGADGEVRSVVHGMCTEDDEEECIPATWIWAMLSVWVLTYVVLFPTLLHITPWDPDVDEEQAPRSPVTVALPRRGGGNESPVVPWSNPA